MKSNNRVQVIEECYELLKEIIPAINKFPKNQKFVLGDRVENAILDILELLIKAYYSKTDYKADILRNTNLKLESTRYLVRLCFELNLLSTRQYENFAKKINSIGNQIGGWIKTLKI